MFVLLPVQATAILDDARRDLKQLDKQFGAELGFDAPPEWSKAKHNVRPLNFHQLCQASDDVQLAIARRWLAALEQKTERDLVADLVGRVEARIARIELALAGLRPAKADLQPEQREREVA
jgi:hypothetical protein